MSYDKEAAQVRSLCLIPKRFFVASVVERRKPLAPTARRAGWVGSNILLGKIPQSGRIFCIKNGMIAPKDYVLKGWQKTAFLDAKPAEARGWLVEVMNCVERLGQSTFSLDDVYVFEAYLASLYLDNNNVRPKIRQQLQVLRDNGYVRFLGKGKYKLTN